MKRIVLLTGNHLCHNPRALKEATTLSRAGYEVEVLGAWLDEILRGRDQSMLPRLEFAYTPVVDLTASRVTRASSAVRSRVGHGIHRWAGWQNRWQFGPTVNALRTAARAHPADLYIAHSEAGSQVAEDLRQSGERVGIDLEDWYSEDLLPEARQQRPVARLRELERTLLAHADHASCPSQAMSAALAQAYGCAPPAVLYNAFAWDDRALLDGMRKDRLDHRVPSLHWYSQTLGEGRGLEDLLAALPRVSHDLEVHLRGRPVAGFDRWLAERFRQQGRVRVFLHPLVENDALLSRIAEHDIGFAGEMKYARSRDLTVTNKMLHYLLAGLAVVASDTAGQREVALQAQGAVTLYPSGDPAALAAAIDALIDTPDRLQQAKAAALRAAAATFCWERQESKLLDGVARALSAPSIGSDTG